MKKVSKNQLRKYEAFCKAWPNELEGHGHPMAALGCLAYTFLDDIERLKEWLNVNNSKIYNQIHASQI